jgi:hypothetical protein
MDIFDEMKKEHNEFRKLAEEITETTDRAVKTREKKFMKLSTNLMAHHQAEEEVLVPILKEHKETYKMGIEIEEEHHAAHQTIHELKDIEVDTDNWIVKFGVLKMIMDHHMEEEENEITKKGREAIEKSRLEKMADKFEKVMEKRKDEMMAKA